MRSNLQKRIASARGETPCDLVLKGGQVFDVFSCRFSVCDIGVTDGLVVAVDSGIQGRREIDCRKRWVVPGFIDAHVHLESSLMVPYHFDRSVLMRGTTTAICDPHEMANVVGVKGIEYFLNAASLSRLDLRVMLSSCVPATHMETNGGGVIGALDLEAFRNHPKVLGLAEMMNFPGVLNRDPRVMEKLEAFSGGIIDGHAPRLRGRDLSAYIASGIQSCHESIDLMEAQEKHQKGMGVWIREGSVAKDLQTLIPMLNLASGVTIGFCTDDRNPLDIATEGHIDHLVRGAIKRGVPKEIVFRSAAFSVARHYGLKKGAIAPGFDADLIVLSDAEAVEIETVIRRGEIVDELEFNTLDAPFLGTVRAAVPEVTDLSGPGGRVHVIDVIPGSIVTARSVGTANEPGVHGLTVVERHGKGSKPANAYVRGFGEKLKGAIASSVGHDSHNLIVVGSNKEDMRTAISHLVQSGGGFVVVQSGSVLAHLDLPIAGLMSNESPEEIVKRLRKLRSAAKTIHCEIHEPFLALAFLSLPVIPSLKLTDRGLVDVDRFSIIPVAV